MENYGEWRWYPEKQEGKKKHDPWVFFSTYRIRVWRLGFGWKAGAWGRNVHFKTLYFREIRSGRAILLLWLQFTPRSHKYLTLTTPK